MLHVPDAISEWAQIVVLNLAQGKHPPELLPKHPILASIPNVRGEFMERVTTGKIKAHRAGVERITPTGLITTTGTELDVDAIIACTGYHIKYPYLPEDVLRADSSKPDSGRAKLDLYKLICPINYPNAFVIGNAEFAGPAYPIYETQARWSAAVVAKKITLPSKQEMLNEMHKLQEWQAKKVVDSDRHCNYIMHISYADDLLRPLGAAPTFSNLMKLVFTSGSPWKALRVLNAVYMKIPAAAQWRLCGQGGKTEFAMDSLLRVTGGAKELTKKEMEELEKTRPAPKTNGVLVEAAA